MKLVNIDMIELKKNVYPEYVKLFPEIERKPYNMLVELYENNILNVLKIMDGNKFIGFFIVNKVENNKYLQVDYFGILPKYQGKGYGNKAIKLLKKYSKNYEGIFIEVEKLGLGKTEVENKQRERRVKFYERLGFYKLNFDINLCDVIFTPYILQVVDNNQKENKIMKEIFEIYVATFGNDMAKRKVKFIK